MKIEWFGVSHCLITTDNGVRIATDPFQYNIIVEGVPLPPGGNKEQPTFTGSADVVTISNGHFGSSYIWAIKGVPLLYTGGAPAEFKGVKFRGVSTYQGVTPQDYNSIICIEADGIRLCHVGNHGHVLNERQVAQIGRVDILITNWDDNDRLMTFEVLDIVLNQLKPKVVLPMHYRVVSDFLTKRKGFVTMDVNKVEFKADTLPSEMKFILLKSPFENEHPS